VLARGIAAVLVVAFASTGAMIACTGGGASSPDAGTDFTAPGSLTTTMGGDAGGATMSLYF
jgi:hypothetical protein